jgi:hypothetical protein
MMMECSHLILLFHAFYLFIIQMAQLVLFQAVLDRIGFNGPSVAALTANGINSVWDLTNLTTKDV